MEINTTVDTISIYCDGACQRNPGKSGSGLAVYIGSEKNPQLFFGDYQEKGTNNTAELNALLYALKLAAKTNCDNVTILTDSKYSMDCISVWAYGWSKKGWTKKGGEIKNLEIIQPAHFLYNQLKHRVSLKHVKGHAGIEGNEFADRMAGMAIVNKNKDYIEFRYDDLQAALKTLSI